LQGSPNGPIAGRRVGNVSMGSGKDAAGLRPSPGRWVTMRYFTDTGPVCGPVLHREAVGAIGVLAAPDDPGMPIGLALCRSWDDAGVAVWELVVRGAALAGQWIIVDREFIRADPGSVSPSRRGS